MTDGYYIHCGGGRREDGNDIDAFREMIDKAGLQKRFFILGHRSDVAGVLASSDIAVHASQGEVGTSLSILEFMRAGLPAVVSDDPTVCQGIRNGVNGLTFTAGDASALAAQVNRLITNPELRHSLGAAARRDIAQYDIKHTVSSLLEVFRGLRI
jgi:glycosyltransferase involved in cell wall biosynthesis